MSMRSDSTESQNVDSIDAIATGSSRSSASATRGAGLSTSRDIEVLR